MPPVGTMTYNPGARFTFNRGFITWFRWHTNSDNAAISFDGSQFVLHSIALPNFRGYCVLRPGWWSWSSNAYTLDHLVTNWYYKLLPDPTEYPNTDLILKFMWDDGERGFGLEFQSAFFNTIVPFDLAQAPPTYWLAPLTGVP